MSPAPAKWTAAIAALMLFALIFVAGACSGGRHETRPTATAPQPKSTAMLAIGGSATEGDGTHDRLRDAWPYLVFREALPLTSTLVNAAVDNATVADAVSNQAPLAREVKPEVVAIWLGADDVRARVPPGTLAQELAQLIRSVRSDGATRVLVADLPSSLGGPLAADYNQAIRGVVTETGSDLVELAHTPVTLVPVAGLPPQPDSPSQRRVADAFERVLRRA